MTREYLKLKIKEFKRKAVYLDIEPHQVERIFDDFLKLLEKHK